MKRFLIYFLLLISIPATAQVRPHHGSHSHHHPGAPNPPHAPSAPLPPGHGTPMPLGMHPNDFEEAVMILSNETFDGNRLSLAKHIVADNTMSARQITNICKLFTFESNRLDFAKFAYHFCVDRNKYFLVLSTFTYNYSKEELLDYIRGR